MNWSAIGFFCLVAWSLVCASQWLDAMHHGDPPSAIRTARNKCAAWLFVAFAALVAGLWGKA